MSVDQKIERALADPDAGSRANAVEMRNALTAARDEIAVLRERLDDWQGEALEAGAEALHLRERLEQAEAALSEPPTFRDFMSTDDITCGYCHAAIGYFRQGAHRATCAWVLAREALAGEENSND